jgi:hypothetical protein
VQLSHYIQFLIGSERELANAYRQIAADHGDEVDVRIECRKFADRCDRHASELDPFGDKYSSKPGPAPDRLAGMPFDGTRRGHLGLLRDLHDVYLKTRECEILGTLIAQAAQGLRDKGLFEVVQRNDQDIAIQAAWLRSRMKQAAPQTLVLSS